MNEKVSEILSKSVFEPQLIQEILNIGRLKRVSAEEMIISNETEGNEIPIVLDGLLKVMRQDKNGNEVFLYFLEGGETCAMSITCCIEGKKTAFHVMAEEDSSLWMIPMTYMDEWIAKYPSFRKFVFHSYQVRFDELLNTIDSVVFLKMYQRLHKYLLDNTQASGTFVVNKTHQQIANEMNTSRVVISRLLKQLEKEEVIELHRNSVVIL
jgi:CRP/FNR family transcriptional regulator